MRRCDHMMLSRSALSTLLGLLALAGCSKPVPPPSQPRPVVAVTVEAGAQSLAGLRTPGEIAARYTTPLSFRVAGKLSERSARLGDRVEAGQRLASLDPADLRKALASADAQRVAADSRLAFARQQLDREQRLIATNVISRAQLDQTRDAAALALAQRDSAAQQAALAKDQLGYASLVADHAGLITAELADTGQNVAAGQAVYQLAWSGDVDVICDLAETALAGVKVGAEARVSIAALPGQGFAASVRELAPAADPASRTYRARLTLRGDAAALAAVRLGMTAEVAFDRTDKDAGKGAAYALPATALFHDGEQPALWVIGADDTLALRKVTIASYGERSIRITDGVAAGDRVVVQGVHSVHAGEKVRAIAPLHPEPLR